MKIVSTLKPSAKFGWLLLAIFLVFLSFKHMKRHKYFSWEGPVWADVAGYFVYMPASLYYEWDGNRVPEAAVERLGMGFSLEENGIIRTKYTYGVALMQLPFYLVADVWVRWKEASAQPRGFSLTHQRAIMVAAIFWLILGLYWLGGWLSVRFSSTVIGFSLMAMLMGSHLWYYSIDSGGMSHVYSFALFAAVLRLLQRKWELGWLLKHWLLFGFVSGLIVVIRPTNALFLLFAVLLWQGQVQEIWPRLRSMLQPTGLILLILAFGLALFPQLLYWKYAHGSWVYYSYQDEGFNWAKPQLIKFLFSPAGGLFWYAPVYWLVVPAWFRWRNEMQQQAMVWLLFTFVLLYVFSCWHNWRYGGGFGARVMIEYLVFAAVPMAYGFEYLLERGSSKRMGWAIGVFVVLVFWGLKLNYSFGRYFFGDGDWDWAYYARMIFK
ncbi:MAG: hypothetical protein ACK417_02260 [Bacteroidia bacterium]